MAEFPSRRRQLASACPAVEPRRLAWLAIALAVAAALALAIDIPVARFCLENRVPGEIRRILSFAEVFAHGYGVFAILLTVWVLAPDSRRKLPRIAACAYLPGLVNTFLKIAVTRHRPHSLGLDGLPSNGLATFDGFFAAVRQANWEALIDRGMQSFTSGHATVAAGLAIGLSWLCPRGGWLFMVFAVLASLQRVASGAHFVSDILAGAALASAAGGILLGATASRRVFNRFECANLARAGDSQ